MTHRGRPLRVLVLMRNHARNGITTYANTVSDELALQGHTVLHWPPPGGWRSGGELGWPFLHPLAAPLLAPLLRAARPDVLMAHHYTQARLAAALQQRTGIPWVAVMHNGHSGHRLRQWQALLQGAAGVVTMCEAMHRVYDGLLAAAGGPVGAPARPRVLCSRLPLRPTALAHLAMASGPHLAYCSRLSGAKGPRCETWLRAIAGDAVLRGARLRVIGGGSDQGRLQRLAQELGLAAEFTGSVPSPVALLTDVDVLTGAGYALIEGLALGCVGVGLGFGGCTGVVDMQGFDAACAVNFGDHSPDPLPSDADTIARALRAALQLRADPQAHRQVHRRALQQFAPGPIVAELAGYLAGAAALRPAVPT
jgi:hypothetical protein